jgi:hypothetical protein
VKRVNNAVTITKVDNRKVLEIEGGHIEIADYNIKSSADGTTELSVVIKGTASTFELSAMIKEQM